VTSGAADAGSELLDVAGLRVTFDTPRGPLVAVDGVNLALAHGETLGIVGESGSGKTVLSRAILGLLPATAHVEGSVRFEERELLGAPESTLGDLRGARIAMVFQDPMSSLNPVHRVGRQIAEPLQVHLGLSRRQAAEGAVGLLEQVGIPAAAQRARAYPVQLSGGMRQRVMIAMALSCGPSLLLADEPTTGLDVTIQAQILDLLADQRRLRSMAMLLVSHDLGVVATRTDRVMVMYAGRAVEVAATNRLFSATKMPYTEGLLGATPRLAERSHTRLVAIPGRPPDPLQRPAGCAFAPRCTYATDKCREAAPPLAAADDDPSHLYACWHPLRGAHELHSPRNADAP